MSSESAFAKPHNSLHPILIAIINMALFVPIMGHGYVHDDFDLLFSVAYDPLWRGLTYVTAGAFYAPVAWVSYRVDWVLWGWNPFAFAASNLLIHTANVLLLYLLAQRLWRSRIAGCWAAIGYALLFPANTSAVMFIGVRAHLLVGFFCLSSMLAALWLARTERYKALAFAMTIVLAAGALFSKESGVAAPMAIVLVLLYERRSANRKNLSVAAIIWLLVALITVTAIYLVLRSKSGAVHITFGCEGYRYCLSPRMIFDHLFRYSWRTYGLLAVLALAITASQYIRGRRPNLRLLTKNDLFFSLLLFAVTVSPAILLYSMSYIYTYLPGIAAALLLGATARSLYEAQQKSRPRYATLAVAPIMLVVVMYAAYMINNSLKWMRMAEVNTTILNQITARHPKAEPNTLFVVTYAKVDSYRRFPEGLSYAFSDALRLLYADPTISGTIVRQGEPCPECEKAPLIHFTYSISSDGNPQVLMSSDNSFFRK